MLVVVRDKGRNCKDQQVACAADWQPRLVLPYRGVVTFFGVEKCVEVISFPVTYNWFVELVCGSRCERY